MAREFRFQQGLDMPRKAFSPYFEIPFTDIVWENRSDPNLKLPEHLPVYKGQGDPLLHIAMFSMATSNLTVSDEVLVKMFSSTLQDKAQQWFLSLPPNSIDGYDELVVALVYQYFPSIKTPQSKKYLYDLRYNPDTDRLRDFYEKFNELALDVNIDLGERVSVLIELLGDVPLWRSPVKKPPEDLREFLDRIYKYIRLYDYNQASRKRDRQAATRMMTEVDQAAMWCDFHKSKSHNTIDCRVYKQCLEDWETRRNNRAPKKHQQRTQGGRRGQRARRREKKRLKCEDPDAASVNPFEGVRFLKV